MYYMTVTRDMDPNGWLPWNADMADSVVSDGHVVPDFAMEDFVVAHSVVKTRAGWLSPCLLWQT